MITFTKLMLQLMFLTGDEGPVETNWMIQDAFRMKITSKQVQSAYNASGCCHAEKDCDVMFERSAVIKQSTMNVSEIAVRQEGDKRWFSKTLFVPRRCVVLNVEHWHSPFDCTTLISLQSSELVGFSFNHACYTFRINDDVIEHVSRLEKK